MNSSCMLCTTHKAPIVQRSSEISRNLLAGIFQSGRIGIIKTLLHLSRLLVKISRSPQLLPQANAPTLFQSISSQNRTITFYSTFVKKTLTEQTSEDLSFFTNFYGTTLPWKLGGYKMTSMTLKNNKGDSTSTVELSFAPAGYKCTEGEFARPATFAALKNVLIDVLTMLMELHERGWVHRDIRWPNIIRSGDSYLSH